MGARGLLPRFQSCRVYLIHPDRLATYWFKGRKVFLQLRQGPVSMREPVLLIGSHLRVTRCASEHSHQEGTEYGIRTFSPYPPPRKPHPTRNVHFRARARSARQYGPRIELVPSRDRRYKRRCTKPKRLWYQIRLASYSNLAEISLRGQVWRTERNS